MVLIFVKGGETSPYTEHPTFLYFVKIFTTWLCARRNKKIQERSCWSRSASGWATYL